MTAAWVDFNHDGDLAAVTLMNRLYAEDDGLTACAVLVLGRAQRHILRHHALRGMPILDWKVPAESSIPESGVWL